MYSTLSFISWLVIVFLAAFVGSRFLPDEWFKQLNKPAWNPPNWVFAPVWTVLYSLMAIAAWLVWEAGGLENARLAMVLFIAQLILNVAWTWFFFGRHRPDLAFADITLLWVFIATTIFVFSQFSALAAILMIPYLLWVSFATCLNFSIWRSNSQTS